MRRWISLPVVLLALWPSSALAVLQVNMERVLRFPTTEDQVVMMDVFVRDLDNIDERLSAFTVGVDGRTNTPGGIRFLPPQPVGAEFPYVFGGFPGSDPEDFGSTFNRIQVGASLPGSTAEVNVVDGVRDGLFSVPILIPANAPVGFYPFVLDISVTDFAGSGPAIVVTAGLSGGLNYLPEPSAAALACVAGIASLRRRRGR